MKILMLATHYGSEDGFAVRRFQAHGEYDVADSLAAQFIRMRAAICREFYSTGELYMPNTRNRLLTRVSAPATEPITSAEAKLYLRVDHSSDDTLISDLITAARMCAEHHLKSSLITQSWKIAYDEYAEEEVALPMGPVASITSVAAITRSGSSSTVSSSAYYVNAAKDKLIFDSVVFAHRMEITYATGYGNAAQVPTPIKQGILAHIASMYDERGLCDYTVLPAQSQSLYAPFRSIVL